MRPMPRPLLSLSLFAASALACATAQPGPPPPGDAPLSPSPKGASAKGQSQRIRNLSYFDVATCFPRHIPVPSQLTETGLLGILLSTRPRVMECLVDPKTRGAADVTRVVVSTTVQTSGSESTVKGENLTPEGERCLREAIEAATGALRVTPAPALRIGKLPRKAPRDEPPPPAPVTAEAQFVHTRDQAPTVTFGVNAASDVVGALRLAQRGWCACYEDWRTESPRTLTAKLKLAPASDTTAPPQQVELAPTGDPRSDDVAACLQRKIAALPLPAPATRLALPGLPFHHVHSGLLQPLEGASPEVQLVHIQAMRGQRASDTALALGERTAAAKLFDRLLTQYRATPAAVQVDDLKGLCEAVLQADDAWAAAVTRQLALDQRAVALIGELKAKAPTWAAAETTAQTMVERTQQDLETAHQARANDEAGCPHLKEGGSQRR